MMWNLPSYSAQFWMKECDILRGLRTYSELSSEQYSLVLRKFNVLVQFNVSDDNFHVREGDHIGWTGEDNNRFVSRDDDTSIPRCTDCTRSKYIVPDSKQVWFPTVRDEPYSGIQLSSRQLVFSAAVSISRRKLHSFTPLFCIYRIASLVSGTLNTSRPTSYS